MRCLSRSIRAECHRSGAAEGSPGCPLWSPRHLAARQRLHGMLHFILKPDFHNRTATAADVLTNSINLIYHPNLMALAGDPAVAEVEKAYMAGGYLLAIEGGVPTKFNGKACWAWSYDDQDVTFQEAVIDLSSRAAGILCIGTCASFGGIAAAPPNPTGVKGVKEVTGKTTINLAGCPTHPNWIAWTVVQLLLGNSIALDSLGRPKTSSRAIRSMTTATGRER